MTNQKRFSIHSRAKSLVFAWKGLKVLFGTQHNMRIHLVMAILAVLGGFIFQVQRWEWCILIFAIGLVFITEALNTALEFLTDLVSPEYHPLAGKVKDVAAAAVLIAAIISLILGGIIFLPHILCYSYLLIG